VFAWEGAVAVARAEDCGRVGSHRFLTCVPTPDIAIAEYLCFHFLTEHGLRQIGAASPGGAGRNRTLGIKALEAIEVPLPPYHQQQWFNRLLQRAQEVDELRRAASQESGALLSSILYRAFAGAL
jgi:type I restriction enzyme S subunit